MRFGKQRDLRLIGHRDLMRCLERMFRRAGLPLGMSQGFHPKPRMMVPSALAVGIEATDEVLELELTEARPAESLLQQLTPLAPPGLTLHSIEILPQGAKKARVHRVSYQIPVPAECREGLPAKIRRLMAGSSCPVRRPHRGTPVDVRPPLEELSLRDGVLRMRLRTGGQRGAGPRDVLAALGLSDLELRGVHLTRSAVEIES